MDLQPAIIINEQGFVNLTKVILCLTGKRAFYEAYSRAMHVIGWFLSDSGKHLVEWMRSRLTHTSNLEKYLFSINYLAHVIRTAHFLTLRSWSYLSTYFSTNFLICCVTLYTDLGGALKRLHLTLTYYIFYFCFFRPNCS